MLDEEAMILQYRSKECHKIYWLFVVSENADKMSNLVQEAPVYMLSDFLIWL